MFPHVYAQRPRYCVAFKAKMILVRLSSGEVREEYFGPPDGDPRDAELELLRRELDAAGAIIAARDGGTSPANPPVAA
jgi:hypothetical protein